MQALLKQMRNTISDAERASRYAGNPERYVVERHEGGVSCEHTSSTFALARENFLDQVKVALGMAPFGKRNNLVDYRWLTPMHLEYRIRLTGSKEGEIGVCTATLRQLPEANRAAMYPGGAEHSATILSGFYVDEGSGQVDSVADERPGFNLEFHTEGACPEVWLVAEDGGVHQEAVLWPSLDAMSTAGIDVSIR